MLWKWKNTFNGSFSLVKTWSWNKILEKMNFFFFSLGMKNIKRIQRKRSWIETHIKPFWWKQGTVSKWRRKRARKEVLSGLPGEKGELGKTQMTTLPSPPVGEIMKAARLPFSLWDQQKYNKMRKNQRRLMTLQSSGEKKKSRITEKKKNKK